MTARSAAVVFPVAVVVAAVALAPRAASAQAETITEQRVRDTVTWLAADERAGRDTGSPELVAAGDWIAARFAAAGLAQVVEGSWTHEFPMTGWLLDQTALQVTVVRKHRDGKKTEIPLVADTDVRQWTVAEVTSGVGVAATVAPLDDDVLQRMLQARSARRPVVCEVAADHPYWKRAEKRHRVLDDRRRGSQPVLLVRDGLLGPTSRHDEDVEWSLTWTAGTPEKVDVPQHNLVALLRGTTRKDEYVIVSAHYDHVGVGRAVDDDAIYNGADDNATGTTAVLLLAESLAKEKLARSVLFVCFTAEERGLRGSAAFCARPPVPLDKVVANLNLEMLGRPEPGKAGKAWVTGAEYSDFAAIAATALARGDVAVVEFEAARGLFRKSDNWSFAQRGVVAHSISAGSLHEDYHQPGDEVDKLDIAHMTRIVRALRELVIELANREQPPQWSEQGARFRK
jgi:hypothetical protein